MKTITAWLWTLSLILALVACSSGTTERVVTAPVAQPTSTAAKDAGTVVQSTPRAQATPTATAVKEEVAGDDQGDLDSGASGSALSYIRLEGRSISFDGNGATVDGSIITITSAGTYGVSGALDDGQILVDTQDEGKVVLVLSGADITCAFSAPIYVVNAEKVVITLADGTVNSVTDGDSYILAAGSDEPNAAVFSNDDLTINGSGSLTVHANYEHGVVSQDDLRITGGDIVVNAVNDGLKGRDSIAVKAGRITVNAGGDGLQSNNDEDAEQGYVAIEGGTLVITAGMDGIQAQTRLMVSGGDITISSGGGSVNSSDRVDWGNWGRENRAAEDPSTPSAKGLKAGADVIISGGTMNVDSSDDCIHSNASLTISGGEILLASGDDGIHSDSTLEISGGDLRITKSYEGIESAVITINEGTIHVVSSDDAINAAGGVDGSSVDGRPGQNRFEGSGNCYLYINGGYIAIDAMGDGLDINGSIDMAGGVLLVNGPTSNGNGPLDYLGTFTISGGFLVAAGSAGMAQAPSPSSSQYSVMEMFSAPQAAGTIVHVESQDGAHILTFAPTKTYQSIVFSSPDLKNGATYSVYVGGSSTGTVTDSLHSGGAYTAGTRVASLTISSIVTGAGRLGGGFPGRGRP